MPFSAPSAFSAVTAFVAAAILLSGCGREAPTTPADSPKVVVRVPTIPSGPYAPGTSYFGRNGYIEYIPGTLPVIITAPHGGLLKPAEIPDRAGGTKAHDTNTDALARAMGVAFNVATGQRPHLIITRLHRNKIDTNRDSAEATEGHPHAVTAWFEFQDFVAVAKNAVKATHPNGFYIDLHGHGHDIARLELGYMITATDLNRADDVLDAASFRTSSSIRTFAENATVSFSELIRGPSSLGAMFVAEGYRAIPSPNDPSPGSDPYFNGQYNTLMNSCRSGGPICGIQLETHFTGVRDNATTRAAFAAAVVRVVDRYMRERTGVRIIQ